MKLKQNPLYLSQKNTNCLKGFLAICVLLCHIWSSVAPNLNIGLLGRGLGVILTAAGYLSVSLFLFLSGYGLMKQYQKHGQNYLKGFWVKRILPLYLLCMILIVFYWGARVFLGETVLMRDVLQSFFFGKTVISKGWYLQSILLWYILFFVSFRCVSKEKYQMLAMLISFVAYLLLCLALKLPSTWYEGAICFPLGLWWAKYQEAIDGYLNRKYFLPLLVSWLFFGIAFLLGNLNVFPVFLQIAFKCISAMAFVVSAILLLRILAIENMITRFLGGIYLEIYVVHGFVLMLFHSKYIYLNNVVLYSIVVLIVSLVLSFALKPFFDKILRLGKKKHA